VKAATKVMNQAPGFLCPACQKVRIKLSLEQFLTSTDVTCPVCSTRFAMDKAECARLVEMLQELHVAQKNVEMLAKQKL
jgi:transcription elongation factor Elf1